MKALNPILATLALSIATLPAISYAEGEVETIGLAVPNLSADFFVQIVSMRLSTYPQGQLLRPFLPAWLVKRAFRSSTWTAFQRTSLEIHLSLAKVLNLRTLCAHT